MASLAVSGLSRVLKNDVLLGIYTKPLISLHMAVDQLSYNLKKEKKVLSYHGCEGYATLCTPIKVTNLRCHSKQELCRVNKIFSPPSILSHQPYLLRFGSNSLS